jgi:chromosome partitioning protein
LLNRLKEKGVEWVFIDLPGRAAAVSSAGLKAADFVLVPCRPLDVDIQSSRSTVQAAVNIGKPYAYLMNIAPSAHDRKRAKEVQKYLREKGNKVADQIIVQRIEVPDAIAAGLGVNEYRPKSESTAEFASLYAWLKKEVK